MAEPLQAASSSVAPEIVEFKSISWALAKREDKRCMFSESTVGGEPWRREAAASFVFFSAPATTPTANMSSYATGCRLDHSTNAGGSANLHLVSTYSYNLS